MGGLSRKAQVIKEVKAQKKKHVLLLDGGSLLFAKPLIPESLLAAKKMQAAGILRAMQKMNYDAVGIAPLDLTAGLEFIAQQAGENPLPWVSANLTVPENVTPFFKPFIIKQTGDISIGIIGLTGEHNQPASGATGTGYRVESWENILQDTLDLVRKKTDMIILLSSYPESVNKQIAEHFSDVHIIIGSGHSTQNRPPKLVANTLTTQTGSRGKYLGIMKISWHDSRRWKRDIPLLQKQARQKLDRINWQLRRITKQYPPAALQQNQAYTTLLRDREVAAAEIDRFQKAAEEDKGASATFTGNFIPLKVALPEDPEVKEIVQQTKTAINDASRKNMEQLRQSALPDKGGIRATMTGWKKCQSCHPAQTAFWQETQHAHARRTLVNIQQEFNPDCINCHITLPTYDQNTVAEQNLLVNLPDDLYDVGCEACHGPGRAHAENPKKIKPRSPTAKTCLTCHTPDHDNMFVFKVKRSSIACPKSAN